MLLRVKKYYDEIDSIPMDFSLGDGIFRFKGALRSLKSLQLFVQLWNAARLGATPPISGLRLVPTVLKEPSVFDAFRFSYYG